MPFDTDLVRKGLKLSHLRLLAALQEEERLGAAAARLGISQPAASRLASELERITGSPVYHRVQNGIQLTREGAALARRARRIMLEIGLADREVRELVAGLAGNVTVGSVTGPAVDVLLPALRSFRLSNPQVSVGVDVGTSVHLVGELLGGRIDFALARLPPGHDHTAFRVQPIGTEPIGFAVRHGHPLTRQGTVGLGALLGYDWVLPFPGTLLRDTIEAALAAKGLPLPQRIVSTSSFLMTLALVRQTNALAPIAGAVVQAFSPSGIASVKLDTAIDVGTYSLISRADTELTPAAEALAAILRRREPA